MRNVDAIGDGSNDNDIPVSPAMSRSGHSAYPSATEWAHVAELWGWSDREGDIVRLLANGDSRKHVAGMLNIAQSTLQTHLRRALWKANAKDIVMLIWRIVEVRDRLRR